MGESVRDTWCTPPELWALGLECVGRARYDLDPCSNERSTVPAKRKVCLPDNGLRVVMLRDEVAWLNPPYSRGSSARWFAWATEQAARGAHVVGVVRLDTSTSAWRRAGPSLAWSPPLRWEFDPPPGVEASKANMVTALVLWTECQDMRAMFSRGLDGLGGYIMVRQAVAA